MRFWMLRRSMRRSLAGSRRYLQDPNKMATLMANAVRKARKNRGYLLSFWEELMILLRMMKAWVTGCYRDVPYRTLIAAAAAILYFVNPLDVIPDLKLPVGYFDDAVLIGWIYKSIRSDIDRFLDWESKQGGDHDCEQKSKNTY